MKIFFEQKVPRKRTSNLGRPWDPVLLPWEVLLRKVPRDFCVKQEAGPRHKREKARRWLRRLGKAGHRVQGAQKPVPP